MNRNAIYTLVVFVLLVASIFALVKSGKKVEQIPTPTTSEETSTTTTEEIVATPVNHEVLYTSLGFSPATLEIKVGDSVTFKNESGKGMWVASNPHPVHSEHSEFDAEISVANGNSWTFTFEKAGSYAYHNHLNSSQGGKIIVE